MKFEFAAFIQEYDYSCMDELRVDLIQTMDYLFKQKGKDAWLSIITSSDRAKEIFELLEESVYNGVQFKLFEDYEETVEKDLESEVVVITINSDCEIFTEGLNMKLSGVMPFIAVDKALSNYDEIVHRYSTVKGDSADYILGFTIE